MDVLKQFCDQFLQKAPVIGAVPFAGAVSRIEDVTAILLYRRDQFQVQMFVVPEGTIIPEHAHPNVDSFEVYVGGNIQLSLDGKHVYSPSILFENKGPLKLASRRGERVRVRPGQIHGATIGAGGAVFLSVQHWLNGVAPHCVGSDYDGVAMGEDHLAKVKFGKATTKPKLTARDAASLEG